MFKKLLIQSVLIGNYSNWYFVCKEAISKGWTEGQIENILYLGKFIDLILLIIFVLGLAFVFKGY